MIYIPTDMLSGEEDSQQLSELELLAMSGFLSIVGLTNIQIGQSKRQVSMPQ